MAKTKNRLLSRVQLRAVLFEVQKGDVTLQELLEMGEELSDEVKQELLAMTIQEIAGVQVGPSPQLRGDRRTGGPYMAGYGAGPGSQMRPVSPPTPHLTRETAYAQRAKVREPQKFETAQESEIIFTCPGCGERFPLGTEHTCAPKPEAKPTAPETAVEAQKETKETQKSTEQAEKEEKAEKKPAVSKAKKP